MHTWVLFCVYAIYKNLPAISDDHGLQCISLLSASMQWEKENSELHVCMVSYTIKGPKILHILFDKARL